MPELVCYTLPYRSVEFERALQGIRRAGYESVGFGLPHADGGYPTEPSVEEADRIGRILEKYELRPQGLYGAKTQADDLDHLLGWIDFAHALGAPMLVWVGVGGYSRFPNELLPKDVYEPRHRAFVERMRRVGDYAADKGVIVTLKPHTGNTGTGPVLKQTLKEIDSPAFRACLDPGNVSYYEGIPGAEDAEAVLDETAALIMKDHQGDRANADFPVPGEGDVDFVRILKGLRARDFDGPLIVERIDGADGSNLTIDEVDRRVTRARENVQEMAQEAGFTL